MAAFPDDSPGAPAASRPRRETPLLARALRCLARREHSRSELARKLAPHAASAQELDQVLAQLEASRLLSEARFVEGLARRRGAGFGVARIRNELREHRVDSALVRAAVDDLQRTELARARALWLRRFGQAAADPAGRARQWRFLAGRGFSAEVIRTLVRGADGEGGEEGAG